MLEEQESPEIIAARHDLVFDILQMRKAFEGESGLHESDQGSLATLAVGAKPAFSPDGKITDVDSIVKAFSQAGLPVVSKRGIILNPESVNARFSAVPALAQFAGWEKATESELALEQSFTHPDQKYRQLMKGFILGYPETALRDLSRAHDLIRNGAPLRIKAIGFNRTASAVDELRGRYINEFGLTDEEAEFLLGQRTLKILNPLGTISYYFQVFGNDSQNAPDILKLQEEVNHAFKKYGF